MNYWLHRIKHQLNWSHPLLKKGLVLSIGYLDHASREFIERHKDNNFEGVVEEIQNDWGYKSKSPFSLRRFLQMQKGDRVVVPDWGTFHVFEILSENLIPEDISRLNLSSEAFTGLNGEKFEFKNGSPVSCATGDVIDLGFFRIVSLVEPDISRTDCADADLTRKLKYKGTTVPITDVANSIENAIDCSRNNKPLNFRSSIVKECAKRVLDIMRRELNPDKLEQLIKKYFDQMGGNTERLSKYKGKGKDDIGDADIVATFESLGLIIYVQAKHYEGIAGKEAVEEVRKFVDSELQAQGEDDYTRICWVISTADDYSSECQNLAQISNVRLVNGLTFAEMILDAGIKPYASFN